MSSCHLVILSSTDGLIGSYVYNPVEHNYKLYKYIEEIIVI